jgi:hypothetical protein
MLDNRNLPGVRGINASKPAVVKGINVNPIYRTSIRNRTGTLAFNGYVPTDFQIALSSGWAPIYSGTFADFMAQSGAVSGGVASGTNALAGLAGGSTRIKAMTAQSWTEPAYLQLSLPIQVHAYSDTNKEVIQQMIKISRLTTPSEKGNAADTGINVNLGALSPPGPAAASSMLQEFGNSNFTIDDEFEFICQIGKFFRMSPCIITNVVGAFDGQLEDQTGNPLGVEFNIEVSSYFAVTQQDIQKWFAGNFGNEFSEGDNV